MANLSNGRARILLTGDYRHDEFTDATRQMRHEAEIVEQPCLTSAAHGLRDDGAIDLIVLAQSRPGQFHATLIEALRQAAPLAPIVALLGSWCEGEMRSGSPWPGVPRVYWHQWPSRFAQEIGRLSAGKPGSWDQPATASAEERLLSAIGRQADSLKGTIAVVSDNVEMAEWLSAACRQAGMSAIVMRGPSAGSVSGIDVVLLNIGLPVPGVASECRRLATSFGDAPLLVLADFPRFADARQWLAAGATAVIAKPISLADLHSGIRNCLGRKTASDRF